eukprot:gene8614-11647_t
MSYNASEVENDSTRSSSTMEDECWISWFCNLNGNHVFCEVEKSYIEDSFNLFGLKQYVNKDFGKVLDTILDRLEPDEADNEDLSRSAALLYGLIHARYIITTNGLDQMHNKYAAREFGECPRYNCKSQPVLPIGIADEPKQGTLKLFCPKCQEVYNCNGSQRHIDGAYFGSTFPHLFFMTYENLVPNAARTRYVPRVFGFKIHPSSSSIPKVESVHTSSKGPLFDEENLKLHEDNDDMMHDYLTQQQRQQTYQSSGLPKGNSSYNSTIMNDMTILKMELANKLEEAILTHKTDNNTPRIHPSLLSSQIHDFMNNHEKVDGILDNYGEDEVVNTSILNFLEVEFQDYLLMLSNSNSSIAEVDNSINRTVFNNSNNDNNSINVLNGTNGNRGIKRNITRITNNTASNNNNNFSLEDRINAARDNLNNINNIIHEIASTSNLNHIVDLTHENLMNDRNINNINNLRRNNTNIGNVMMISSTTPTNDLNRPMRNFMAVSAESKDEEDIRDQEINHDSVMIETENNNSIRNGSNGDSNGRTRVSTDKEEDDSTLYGAINKRVRK